MSGIIQLLNSASPSGGGGGAPPSWQSLDFGSFTENDPSNDLVLSSSPNKAAFVADRQIDTYAHIPMAGQLSSGIRCGYQVMTSLNSSQYGGVAVCMTLTPGSIGGAGTGTCSDYLGFLFYRMGTSSQTGNVYILDKVAGVYGNTSLGAVSISGDPILYMELTRDTTGLARLRVCSDSGYTTEIINGTWQLPNAGGVKHSNVVCSVYRQSSSGIEKINLTDIEAYY